MEVDWCEYLMFTNWSVLSSPAWGPRVGRLQSRIAKAGWLVERAVPFRRPNRFTSPYIVCLARNPASSERGGPGQERMGTVGD